MVLHKDILNKDI